MTFGGVWSTESVTFVSFTFPAAFRTTIVALWRPSETGVSVDDESKGGTMGVSVPFHASDAVPSAMSSPKPSIATGFVSVVPGGGVVSSGQTRTRPSRPPLVASLAVAANSTGRFALTLPVRLTDAESVGGVESTVNACVVTARRLPRLSTSHAEKVCSPSESPDTSRDGPRVRPARAARSVTFVTGPSSTRYARWSTPEETFVARGEKMAAPSPTSAGGFDSASVAFGFVGATDRSVVFGADSTVTLYHPSGW